MKAIRECVPLFIDSSKYPVHSVTAETNILIICIFARLHKYPNNKEVFGYAVNDVSALILALSFIFTLYKI